MALVITVSGFESVVYEVEGFEVSLDSEAYEAGDYYKRGFGDDETVSAWRERFVKKYPLCGRVDVYRGDREVAHGNMLLKNLRKSYSRDFLAYEILELRDRIRKLESSVEQEPTPYQILELDEKCDLEQAKQARAKMVRLFHPDKYESMDLPQVVRDFVTAKMQKINGAFDMIRERLVAEEEVSS